MGAGFRGSSTLFQSTSEFLKTSKNETLTSASVSVEPARDEEEQDAKPETKRSKTSPSVSSSSSSPSKRSGKALSKKQQKFAEAAKNSHCISQYFGKKIMDETPKNNEATVSVAEEASAFVETRHNLKSNNTETQHERSMDMESTEKNTRRVEKQTLDDISMDMSTTDGETHTTEEATQGIEERTMLEAEGYDQVTPLILYPVDFFFLSDHVGAVWNVLIMFFALLHTLAIGRSQSVTLRHNQKR